MPEDFEELTLEVAVPYPLGNKLDKVYSNSYLDLAAGYNYTQHTISSIEMIPHTITESIYNLMYFTSLEGRVLLTADKELSRNKSLDFRLWNALNQSFPQTKVMIYF